MRFCDKTLLQQESKQTIRWPSNESLLSLSEFKVITARPQIADPQAKGTSQYLLVQGRMNFTVVLPWSG